MTTIAFIDAQSLMRLWNDLLSSPGQAFAAVCDFTIIAVVIYGLLYFLRGTRSANVLFGITAFLAIAGMLAKPLHLFVVDTLLTWLWPTLGMAIIIIFQPEIRRFFAQAGSVFSHSKIGREVVGEVVNASVQMAENRVGALIVFERNIGLEGIVNSAVRLDAKVNSLLLQTIFFKNSPLHDCAVVIKKNRIVAARAVLPLTQEDAFNPARKYGTRHRAAVGITEETDAVALVVSEETGRIALAFKGRLVRGYTADELAAELNYLLIEKGSVENFLKRASRGPLEVQRDLFDEDEPAEPAGKEKRS